MGAIAFDAPDESRRRGEQRAPALGCRLPGVPRPPRRNGDRRGCRGCRGVLPCIAFMATATSTNTPEKLPRTLGLWSSVALVIGITIGSGIFRSPASVARLVPSPLLMIGLWAGGGAITLCGALSLAELAAAL